MEYRDFFGEKITLLSTEFGASLKDQKWLLIWLTAP
jgi:hypothetical protein